MSSSRRSFLGSGALFLAPLAAVGNVILATSPARADARHAGARYADAQRRRPFRGYGDLVQDPNGVIDLPSGFHYEIFSREGDALSDGSSVPSSHDGMAAFAAGRHRTWLVRNHELNPDDVAEDGLIAVPLAPGRTYDHEAVGGTTTLLVDHERRLLDHRVSLAGTLDNCAGGPTPWGTWLTCEETDAVLAKPHGYVFEVDPKRGGNPEPITSMGRFEHEAVSFDRRGRAYLTEDAGGPFGCFYRFTPHCRLGGRGSLHAGGELEAMRVVGVSGDLSAVLEQGARFDVRWVPIANSNPGEDDTTVREQAIGAGATPIPKAEGTWTGTDGSIWFVSSRGDGPNAEDPEDASAGEHSGQIWRYDPRAESIELVALFPKGSPFDGPDNITASPHGYALACTDGEDDQWLVGIDESGLTFPFAFNAMNDVEFAGATFSPDGETLFVNIQEPGLTFAIWGHWAGPWTARR